LAGLPNGREQTKRKEQWIFCGRKKNTH